MKTFRFKVSIVKAGVICLGILSGAFGETDGMPNPGNTSRLPVPRIERVVFLVEHEKGSGSGFLMQDDGKVYFVSNVHVLAGGANFSIRNVYGETIQVPEAIEVAADRDLVRFQVPSYPGGLCAASQVEFGDTVCALGNSGGAGVITRLDGEILALGPDLVEVSSKFIPGNSGGPVVDASNEVVGVATYISRTEGVPDWLIEGSRFEGARRMTVRVDKARWLPLSWTQFREQTEYVNEVEEYAEAVVHIVGALSDDAYKMIYCDVDHRKLQDWLSYHNRDVRQAGGRLKRISSKSKVTYEMSSSMQRKFKVKIDQLAELMEDFKRDASRGETCTVPYFKEQLDRYGRYFDNSRQHMETVVETMF